MDDCYNVMCFWLVVCRVLCAKVVGANSSEAFQSRMLSGNHAQISLIVKSRWIAFYYLHETEAYYINVVFMTLW